MPEQPGEILSSPFFSSLLAGFLESLEVGRAAIVGNPYGGLVALRLVPSKPGRLCERRVEIPYYDRKEER